MRTTPSLCPYPAAWLGWEPAPPRRLMRVRRDRGRREAPLSTAAVTVIAPVIASLLLTLTGCTVNIYWHVITSPNQGSGGSALTRLAAVTATNIWAVGSYTPTSGSPGQTLIEHYDGKSWSIVSSPNQGSGDNVLNDVAEVTAKDIWAVGYYSPTSSSARNTLTQHWNGTSCSIVTSPNPGSGSSYLIGIAAVTTSDVWAVGYSTSTSTGPKQTLIEHWDGASWKILP